MSTIGEKDNIKANLVRLEFLSNMVLLFLGFLIQFQKNGPTVQILHLPKPFRGPAEVYESKFT